MGWLHYVLLQAMVNFGAVTAYALRSRRRGQRIPTIWRPKDASPKYEQLAFLLQFLSRYLGEKCLFWPLTHPRPRPVPGAAVSGAPAAPRIPGCLARTPALAARAAVSETFGIAPAA